MPSMMLRCPVDGACPEVNSLRHQAHYRHACTFHPCPYRYTFPEHAEAFIHEDEPSGGGRPEPAAPGRVLDAATQARKPRVQPPPPGPRGVRSRVQFEDAPRSGLSPRGGRSERAAQKTAPRPQPPRRPQQAARRATSHRPYQPTAPALAPDSLRSNPNRQPHRVPLARLPQARAWPCERECAAAASEVDSSREYGGEASFGFGGSEEAAAGFRRGHAWGQAADDESRLLYDVDDEPTVAEVQPLGAKRRWCRREAAELVFEELRNVFSSGRVRLRPVATRVVQVTVGRVVDRRAAKQLPGAKTPVRKAALTESRETVVIIPAGGPAPASDRHASPNSRSSPSRAGSPQSLATVVRNRQDHLLQDHPQQDHLQRDHLLQDHLQQNILRQDHLQQDKLQQDHLQQDNLHQDNLHQDNLHQDNLQQDHLRQDRLRQDHLRQDHLQQDNLQQDHLRQDRLQQGHLRQDRLQQGHLRQDHLQQDRQQEDHPQPTVSPVRPRPTSPPTGGARSRNRVVVIEDGDSDTSFAVPDSPPWHRPPAPGQLVPSGKPRFRQQRTPIPSPHALLLRPASHPPPASDSFSPAGRHTHPYHPRAHSDPTRPVSASPHSFTPTLRAASSSAGCGSCGGRVPGNAVFCIHCGKRVAGEPAAPQQRPGGCERCHRPLARAGASFCTGCGFRALGGGGSEPSQSILDALVNCGSAPAASFPGPNLAVPVHQLAWCAACPFPVVPDESGRCSQCRAHLNLPRA
ncbi:hypothetical protein DIPPA_13134 [Diplonema papillatum]|nr:hypothetical protein DIPPA_13134 [Diplonema papillatum]